MSKPKPAPATELAPHSWDIEHWPRGVYPHTSNRGRYVVRAHRNELMIAGALTRVGRELVVIGQPYARWLTKRAAKVADYEIAPNRAQPTS